MTALLLATSALLSAADTFEGRIHITVTSGKKDPMTLQYAVKGDLMRMEMPVDKSSHGGMAGGGIIIDFKQKEMLILMEQEGQKMFMRRPLPQPGEGQAATAGKLAAEAKPVATGRTEMIAGYLATEYRVDGSKGGATELWLATGLGNFMFPSAQGPMGQGRGASASPGWEKFAREGGGFPLRAITRNAAGAEESHWEVTQIEKTTLPASLFSTEGYTEFQMPDMNSMMRGMTH
jgi:hypothetical protein